MNENVQMNKEDVLATTINLLGNINVPVSLKEQITDHIAGAIYNLKLVMVMCQREKEVNEKTDADSENVNELDFGGDEDDGNNSDAGRTEGAEGSTDSE